MAKHSYSSDSDQFDPKVFKESLGSFGTTTTPGANQLTELQTKIRQGVKHVELHLASTGKGQFNVQDVPDKYGFEQRRTIMQLAKMNEQSLSVHGTFDVTSFSGLAQGGINESQRLNSFKEIDETVKFASETAKGGAVVFHIQGDPVTNDRGELNVSKEYLDWLKKNKPEEYDKVKKNYFDQNYLKRQFVSNPENELEVKMKFKNLQNENPEKYKKYVDKANTSGEKRDPWEYYYMDEYIEKQKLAPERNPLIMIGDTMSQVDRQQEFVDMGVLRTGNGLDSTDKEVLRKLNLDVGELNLDDYQRAMAIFTNGMPGDYMGIINESDYNNLRNKLLITYEKVWKDSDYSQAQADETYMKKLVDYQINQIDLQKEDLDINKKRYGQYLDQINEIKKQERVLMKELDRATKAGDKEKEKEILMELNGGKLSESEDLEFRKIREKAQSGQEPTKEEIERYYHLAGKVEGLKNRKQYLEAQEIGQLEYQKLDKYHEAVSQLNEKKNKLMEQRDKIRAVTDVSFEKNTSAMGHLGIKALRYQLDLKKKAKVADQKVKEYTSRLNDLEKRYNNASGVEKDKLHNEINKVKYEMRNWVGVKDYDDIDLIEKPLYLAPENMLPGMGSLTSIEEFKAVMRMSQKEFADKILSDEPEYKKLKEEYEQETGLKIRTEEDAIKLAKRHLAGTFDNAHAAVWLKHFRKEEGESDEHRIERFNKWLNDQSVEMFKEGLIKHVHFNDTMGKDDDHNLLGSGILDLHDMRERLRKAGLKEPLIVEAGGRGANQVMHIKNAFDIFNPNLMSGEEMERRGYSVGSVIGGDVSDWINTRRNYTTRPQFSHYGMNYNTFRSQPQQGVPRGGWSNVGFF